MFDFALYKITPRDLQYPSSWLSRKGSIRLSYAELIALIGPAHTTFDRGKIDVEWDFEGGLSQDRARFIISNYKNGPNSKHPFKGLSRLEDIPSFSIAWNNKKAADLAELIFGKSLVPDPK